MSEFDTMAANLAESLPLLPPHAVDALLLRYFLDPERAAAEEQRTTDAADRIMEDLV